MQLRRGSPCQGSRARRRTDQPRLHPHPCARRRDRGRTASPPGTAGVAGYASHVVHRGDGWVQANFRETQLTKSKWATRSTFASMGIPASEMRGRVLEIAPASGSQFALLPPDNATGNFTKVVQRVPVKIALDDSAQATRLRSGLSAVVTVRTKCKRADERTMSNALPSPATPSLSPIALLRSGLCCRPTFLTARCSAFSASSWAPGSRAWPHVSSRSASRISEGISASASTMARGWVPRSTRLPCSSARYRIPRRAAGRAAGTAGRLRRLRNRLRVPPVRAQL